MRAKPYKKVCLDEMLKKKARLLSLAGDETRIRILCFMFRHKKACVGDIAKSLNMTLPSISHHLRIMKDNGFFVTERTGISICYALSDDDFIKSLKKLICDTKVGV